jgi:hypothetical protein
MNVAERNQLAYVSMPTELHHEYNINILIIQICYNKKPLTFLKGAFAYEKQLKLKTIQI